MSIFIEDGKGKGYKVGVSAQGQLETQAEIHELQHHISKHDGEVYQIIGLEPTIAAATQTVLHITNNDSSRRFAVSYIRLEVAGAAGGTALPDDATYFQMGFGTTASGGVATVPVNMNDTSGNLANVTALTTTPTSAGTFQEFDRWYPNTSMMTFNKHGSLILGFNGSMEIRLVSDMTSGIAYARVTGMYIDD